MEQELITIIGNLNFQGMADYIKQVTVTGDVSTIVNDVS